MVRQAHRGLQDGLRFAVDQDYLLLKEGIIPLTAGSDYLDCKKGDCHHQHAAQTLRNPHYHFEDLPVP